MGDLCDVGSEGSSDPDERVGQGLAHSLHTVPPPSPFATLQGSVAIGFGLWSLGREVILGLPEHQVHGPGCSQVRDIPPVGVSLLTSPLEALAVHLRFEEN